jgi:hypothetical protein
LTNTPSPCSSSIPISPPNPSIFRNPKPLQPIQSLPGNRIYCISINSFSSIILSSTRPIQSNRHGIRKGTCSGEIVGRGVLCLYVW